MVLRSSSVMVRLTVLMALFWSTDWMCMVTIWLESMSRKSFKSWSLMSDAVMLRKLAAQKMPPIWNVREFLKAKAVGAMASFTDSPLFTRSFQSK